MSSDLGLDALQGASCLEHNVASRPAGCDRAAACDAFPWSEPHLGAYFTFGPTGTDSVSSSNSLSWSKEKSPLGAQASFTIDDHWCFLHERISDWGKFSVLRSPALTVGAKLASSSGADYWGNTYAAPVGYASVNAVHVSVKILNRLQFAANLQGRLGYTGVDGGELGYLYSAGGLTLEFGSKPGSNVAASVMYQAPITETSDSHPQLVRASFFWPLPSR